MLTLWHVRMQKLEQESGPETSTLRTLKLLANEKESDPVCKAATYWLVDG